MKAKAIRPDILLIHPEAHSLYCYEEGDGRHGGYFDVLDKDGEPIGEKGAVAFVPFRGPDDNYGTFTNLEATAAIESFIRTCEGWKPVTPKRDVKRWGPEKWLDSDDPLPIMFFRPLHAMDEAWRYGAPDWSYFPWRKRGDSIEIDPLSENYRHRPDVLHLFSEAAFLRHDALHDYYVLDAEEKRIGIVRFAPYLAEASGEYGIFYNPTDSSSVGTVIEFFKTYRHKSDSDFTYRHGGFGYRQNWNANLDFFTHWLVAAMAAHWGYDIPVWAWLGCESALEGETIPLRLPEEQQEKDETKGGRQ